MVTLNVKIPDGLEAKLDSYVAASSLYLNRSEFVRDAIRHELTNQPSLSSQRTYSHTHRSHPTTVEDLERASPEEREQMRLVERYIRDLHADNPAGAPHDALVTQIKSNEGLSEQEVESALDILLDHKLAYEVVDGKYQMATTDGEP